FPDVIEHVKGGLCWRGADSGVDEGILRPELLPCIDGWLQLDTDAAPAALIVGIRYAILVRQRRSDGEITAGSDKAQPALQDDILQILCVADHCCHDGVPVADKRLVVEIRCVPISQVSSTVFWRLDRGQGPRIQSMNSKLMSA